MDNAGMSVWSGPATFKANCKLEIGNWPFDNQTCELGFGSYTYGVGRMDIKLFKDTSGEFTSKYIDTCKVSLSQSRSPLLVSFNQAINHVFHLSGTFCLFSVFVQGVNWNLALVDTPGTIRSIPVIEVSLY